MGVMGAISKNQKIVPNSKMVGTVQESGQEFQAEKNGVIPLKNIILSTEKAWQPLKNIIRWFNPWLLHCDS